MKILLIRLRLVGDVVFTTPAIRALRRHFSGANISYLVEPAALEVVAGNPHLDEVIVAPATRGIDRFKSDLSLGRRLRAERFDLVIDFHGGPRASWFAWASRAPERIGYRIVARSWVYTTTVERPKELRRRHSVENQWDLLEPLGIPRPDRRSDATEMPVSPQAAISVADRLAGAGVLPAHQLIVIHVSAGNRFRRWPAESFVELIERLVRQDPRRRVLVTSGPSDAAAVRAVADAARARLRDHEQAILNCHGDFTLAELRAMFECASLFIGGDSGPLHVAGTTAVPVVALFGPTLPERSGPWRDLAITTELIDVGELPCRPCDQRRCVPGDFRCLTGLSPDAVVAGAERALAASRPGHGPSGLQEGADLRVCQN